MTGLADLLECEATRIDPRPSLADVHARVRRHRRRRLVTAAVVAVVALAAVTGVSVGGSTAPLDPVVEPLARPAAIVIPGDDGSTGLGRHDPDALTGPWTVVVRAEDGSLAHHSAVVSFPVPPAPLAEPVGVGETNAVAATGQVVWPIAGSHARVRGDLSRDRLVAIAEATSIDKGRPVVAAVGGLTIGVSRPYRAPDIHEVRIYGSDSPLGFVYTGVQVGGGFEDQALAAHGRTGYVVQGHPAVVSTVEGGNGTIAWEPEPGVVAYVGYSGPTLDDGAITRLIELANRTVPIDDTAWAALAPQVVVQHNGPDDM